MWKFTNKYVPNKHMEKFSKFSRNTFQSSSRFSEDNYSPIHLTVTCVIISIAKSVFILICRETGFFKDRFRLFVCNLRMNNSYDNV